jgi:hypothetical protein
MEDPSVISNCLKRKMDPALNELIAGQVWYPIKIIECETIISWIYNTIHPDGFMLLNSYAQQLNFVIPS